jgi:hypothetical protein
MSGLQGAINDLKFVMSGNSAILDSDECATPKSDAVPALCAPRRPSSCSFGISMLLRGIAGGIHFDAHVLGSTFILAM